MPFTEIGQCLSYTIIRKFFILPYSSGKKSFRFPQNGNIFFFKMQHISFHCIIVLLVVVVLFTVVLILVLVITHEATP